LERPRAKMNLVEELESSQERSINSMKKLRKNLKLLKKRMLDKTFKI